MQHLECGIQQVKKIWVIQDLSEYFPLLSFSQVPTDARFWRVLIHPSTLLKSGVKGTQLYYLNDCLEKCCPVLLSELCRVCAVNVGVAQPAKW